MIYSGSIQAKPHESSAPSLEDDIPFQCLLNIPMGISPADVKRLLSNCQNVKLYDVNDQNMSQGLDLSSYINQVLYNVGIQTYSEGQDSLQYLTFSFFKGALYSIEGRKYSEDEMEEERTKDIVSQFQEQFGKPKFIAKTVYWQTSKWKEKTPTWKIGSKTLSFDTYTVPSDGYFIIKDDSIFMIVDEIRNSAVDIEVFTYSGSDPKQKQYISSWAYTDGEGKSYSNPEITTYCEGVGNINLKGKASGLTFTITCDDGTVVFEKTGINVKGKATILKKNQFPDKCESKDHSYDPNNPTYSTHYKITISKLGHPLFEGNIFRDECND